MAHFLTIAPHISDNSMPKKKPVVQRLSGRRKREICEGRRGPNPMI